MNIEKLKDAYEASTPGEWEDHDGIIYGIDAQDMEESYLVCDVVGNPTAAVNEQDKHNAEFIALAHNMMPQLLEAVELLEELSNWADHLQAICSEDEFRPPVSPANNARALLKKLNTL